MMRWIRERLGAWKARASRRGTDPALARDVLEPLGRLDGEVRAQLRRAVDISEAQSLDGMTRTGDLRKLSSRLVDYLDQARRQSEAMQDGMEQNATIIAELGAFVRRLPEQIAEERAQFGRLVGEVKKLQDMTEAIRHMARQTEILAINAAVEAARAGSAGRGFAVLAQEVRRLASESNSTAAKIDCDIAALVKTVESGYSAEFQARTRHNEAESARLSSLTKQLDDSYVDMRQFYQLLMAAVTQHNRELDDGIAALLGTGQYQDVLRQIIERAAATFEPRHEVTEALVSGLAAGAGDAAALAGRSRGVLDDYLAGEAVHEGSTHAGAAEAGAAPLIELF